MRRGKPETAAVIIPAWNEEETIGAVIGEVYAQPYPVDVLVVSDGSRDRTARLAREAGAHVVELPLNLGVGGAMRAGYRWAVSHGYRLTVQVDADGQHNPADIDKLVRALDGADIVIGARFSGAGDYRVKGPRAWAMKLLSWTLKVISKKELRDTTSGFRAAGPRGTAFMAANYPAEYLGDTVETLVMAARAGLVIDQVPVAMRSRQAGVASQSPLKLVTSMLRLMVAVGLSLIRKPYPLSEARWDPMNR
ncbi:MAG: glycosyltransferase family 2 protein [Actinomycetaceae bacterium]|nr:glycosyltransferase family 2 protein [Actinomycetaceae bacterium]